MEFHGLYSNHEFFENEGVVGSKALCKAAFNGKGFECQMPWNETVTMSKTKFVDLFVRERPINGNEGKCKRLEEI